MSNWKEIERFNHDDIMYIVGYETIDSSFGKIPFLMFLISTKSGKKIRDKKTADKFENHFSLIKKINNPVKLYRKITSIFTRFLESYDYVCFSHHQDKLQSRTDIYHSFMTGIGFKRIYIDEDKTHYYCRNALKDYVDGLYCFFEKINWLKLAIAPAFVVGGCDAGAGAGVAAGAGLDAT